MSDSMASSLLYHTSGGSVCLSVMKPTIVCVFVVQLFTIIHCDDGGLMILQEYFTINPRSKVYDFTHCEHKVIHVYTVPFV